jgi:PadR family transcriptional regulator, regulatory protein PadR
MTAVDYKKQIKQRLTRNLLDIQLLRVLETEPMWGYKIKKTFESNVGVTLRHGALYPTLSQLEKSGLIKSQSEPFGGRVRKTYKLTPKGKEVLKSYYAVLKEQIKNRNNK